jgi:aminopeptidase N
VIQIKRPFLFLIFNFSFLIFLSASCAAQPLSDKKQFTHQDTLRGSNTPERAWWDVDSYSITVKPNFEAKTIDGVVKIEFKKLTNTPATTRMQIDLQQPMILDSATFFVNDTVEHEVKIIPATFTREGNVYWLETAGFIRQTSRNGYLLLFYHGKPREAVRPPWDGGWIWAKDKKGRPWMSVACQGLGASVWYPCKDIQSDEPDLGASLKIIVPDSLTAVGNGKLEKKTSNGNGTTTWTWWVRNPINNYTIIPYIGKYVTWHEDFAGEKGNLDCDYWVLDYELEKAKQQFKQVPLMLKCFEYWFGPYPFYEDGYKLVQAPHLGMEHQSAVAYGNGFQNGYLGRDLSGTGWGNKWDFIIVHESGHEWFANNITTNDIADMWVHEGFTNYSETLFTTCQYGVEAGNAYCLGTRQLIQNDIPIIGPYGVNQEGSGDMYYKGGNLLHTIRQCINNDSTFRNILRGLNSTFYHKTVTSAQIEAYISKQSGIDLSKVFDQYLRTTQIPVLEYQVNRQEVKYRFTNCIKGFTMPLKVTWGNTPQWIHPTEAWKTLTTKNAAGVFSVDKNFYIKTKA